MTAPASFDLAGRVALVNNAGIANLSGGILQETAESWDT